MDGIAEVSSVCEDARRRRIGRSGVSSVSAPEWGYRYDGSGGALPTAANTGGGCARFAPPTGPPAGVPGRLTFRSPGASLRRVLKGGCSMQPKSGCQEGTSWLPAPARVL